MHHACGCVRLAALSILIVGASPAWAEGGRRPAGDVRAYAAEMPHPYPAAWTGRVFSPGAEFIRIHFTRLHLSEGDFLTVSSPDGSQVWTYTGPGPARRR